MQGFRSIRIVNRGIAVDGHFWEWKDGANIDFVSQELGYRQSSLPPDFEWEKLSIWYAQGTRCLIGMTEDDPPVWRFDFRRGTIEEACRLEGRSELESGLKWCRGLFATECRILMAYESGVVAFDVEGDVVWRRDHRYLDAELRGVTDECIEFATEKGWQVRYSVNDGQILEGN